MLCRLFARPLLLFPACLIVLAQTTFAAENTLDPDSAALQTDSDSANSTDSSDSTNSTTSIGSTTATLTASTDRLEQITQYEDQIADLQSEFGPYHENLLEPLSALAQIYIEAGDYEEAGSLLGQHLQVMRAEQGFDNPALIPFIEALIPNSLQMDEIEEVSDHFDHIRHLHGRNDNPALVLQAMEDQANWYLTSVYLGESRQRVGNFRKARELFDDMLDYAEDTYGEDDPAIIPWLYQEAVSQYRLVAMLNSNDGLGDQAVDRILRFEDPSRVKLIRGTFIDTDRLFGPGSNVPIIDGDELIGERYLEEGLRRVNKIRRLLEDTDDLEAQAMADIYYADFQLLLDRGSAHRNYRKAREKLLEAGIPSLRVDAFFNRPILLPVNHYFNRLEEAIIYQQSLPGANLLEVDAEGSLHLGQFTAWSESLPSSRQPPQPVQLGELSLAYNKAELSFTINRNGETSSVKVLSSDPDSGSVRRDARDGVRGMRFRPRIGERRSQRIKDVHLEYFYPPKNP